ncbi:hypothetical protein D9M72_643510 [compost metagenome]
MSSRPRRILSGKARAAARPSSEIAALASNRWRKVLVNSPRKASWTSPLAASIPCSRALPEAPSPPRLAAPRWARLECCSNANNRADMQATPMAPPRERNRLVVLVATPMSAGATAF